MSRVQGSVCRAGRGRPQGRKCDERTIGGDFRAAQPGCFHRPALGRRRRRSSAAVAAANGIRRRRSSVRGGNQYDDFNDRPSRFRQSGACWLEESAFGPVSLDLGHLHLPCRVLYLFVVCRSRYFTAGSQRGWYRPRTYFRHSERLQQRQLGGGNQFYHRDGFLWDRLRHLPALSARDLHSGNHRAHPLFGHPE